MSELKNDNIEWKQSNIYPPDTKSPIEVSYDGITVDDTVEWTESRTCMLAGIGGGNGYFGAGWATNMNAKCESGLICDEPPYWRYKKQ